MIKFIINENSKFITGNIPLSMMLSEIIKVCSPQKGGFVDCTFGGGGYSKALLNFPKTNVIG